MTRDDASVQRRRRGYVRLALLGLCTATACGTGAAPLTYGDPTDGFTAPAHADTAGGAADTAVPDESVPPTLSVTSPSDGAVVDDEVVVLSGVASDTSGIDSVRVRVDQGTWLVAQLEPIDAGTAGQGSAHTQNVTWKAWVTVPPGDHVVHATARDRAGNASQLSVKVHRVRVATLTARLPEKAAAPVTLQLDKAAVKALIPTQSAKELVIYLLDVRPLLATALEAVKAPTVWGLNTQAWGTAEWNMHEVLTMTPDTVNLAGTSAEPLMLLAANLGLSVPLLLADIAGISPTTAFLSTSQVAEAMFRSVVAGHPALVLDPEDGVKKVPVTLYDALEDLITLDTKLGPAGGHPGIVYKSAPAPVLLPDFKITLTGRSNLREFEGMDLSGGQRWLFLKAAGDDVVTFDFLDEQAFQISGVADEPLVDLYVLATEHKGFVDMAYKKDANPDGPYFKGASAAWSLPTWTAEHMVIDAVYHAFRERFSESNYQASKSYDVGALKDASTWSWDKGWLSIQTVAGIGAPPSPSYWWDLVLELAQKRLHDGGIAEGKATLHLPITGVPVSITSDDIIAKARKLFEAQKSKLAAASVGDHSTYDTGCDLFVLRNKSGAVGLFFVAAADLPGAPKTHAKPGFFADASLSQKVSTTAEQGFGDTAHEQVLLADGAEQTLYAADRDGSVWRLSVKRSGFQVRVASRPEVAP